jgi:hypothetical protein
MRHYIFIKKDKELMESIKLYGSITSLLAHEQISIGGSILTYSQLMYRLRDTHEYENEIILIKRCNVIASKKVIKK